MSVDVVESWNFSSSQTAKIALVAFTQRRRKLATVLWILRRGACKDEAGPVQDRIMQAGASLIETHEPALRQPPATCARSASAAAAAAAGPGPGGRLAKTGDKSMRSTTAK